MASTPPNWNPGGPGNNPGQPYDPANPNDPRLDPRWQRAQQRFLRDQQRAAINQERAASRAQAAAWRAQTRAQREQWKMYWRGQRRTSVIGPVLLIAIGLVFFLIHSGRLAPYVVFHWYSRWWPVLLIAIGGLRLAEWAIDRARQPQGSPPMRYSMGGGAVFAVIVLASLGFATHTLSWRADNNTLDFFGFQGADHMGHFFGQKHEEDVPAVTHEIAPGASLTINSPHGDVSVSGTSDDGKVHLSVHKVVYTNSDSVATDRLRSIVPSFEGAASDLTLSVPAMESSSADLTLLIPANARVTVNGDRGDVHVSNMKAPLSVTSNNGDVEVAAITGSVQVHANHRRKDVNIRSVTGDVTVDGNGDEITLSDISGSSRVNGDFYGGAHLQHVAAAVDYHSSRTDLHFARLPGEMEIDGNDLSASEAVGPMLIQTRSRNISLDRVTGDIKVLNNHGDVNLKVAPPTGTITVDNQNGNVSLTLPEKAKFTLAAETSDGDAHSDFGGNQTRSGRGALSESVNGGGNSIRLNTSHGDISVGRYEGLPLPQVPSTPKVLTLQTPSTPALPEDAAAALDDVRQKTADAREAGRRAAQEGRQAAVDARQQAREAAQEAAQQAREAMQQAKEKQRMAERLAREAARSQN